jgi:hypothetical protein
MRYVIDPRNSRRVICRDCAAWHGFNQDLMFVREGDGAWDRWIQRTGGRCEDPTHEPNPALER